MHGWSKYILAVWITKSFKQNIMLNNLINILGLDNYGVAEDECDEYYN